MENQLFVWESVNATLFAIAPDIDAARALLLAKNLDGFEKLALGYEPKVYNTTTPTADVLIGW